MREMGVCVLGLMIRESALTLSCRGQEGRGMGAHELDRELTSGMIVDSEMTGYLAINKVGVGKGMYF